MSKGILGFHDKGTLRGYRQFIGKIKLSFALILLMCGATIASNSACFTPNNLNVSNASTDHIDITWSDFSTPSDVLFYEVYVHESTEDPTFDVLDTLYTKSVSLQNLSSGHSYFVYVRTICVNGPSNWSSGNVFHTSIDNNLACGTSLLMRDNNCPFQDAFTLEVSNEPGFLGTDLFIREVKLTVDHDWPADLEFQLRSPSGIIIDLVKDMGLGTQDFGNPMNPCSESLLFDMDACNLVENGSTLQGRFRPMGDMQAFYDGSSAVGSWHLLSCDDAQGQVGRILHFEMSFVGSICSAPDHIFLQNLSDSSAEIIVPASECDSLLLIYESLAGNHTDTLVVTCSGDTIQLTNLLPALEYVLTYAPICDAGTFTNSCPQNFTTSCDSISYYEDFNNLNECLSSCISSCETGSIWTNTSEAQWLVHEGPTTTLQTGPAADFYGNGKYIYLESSDTLCDNELAILQSDCLLVTDSSVCHVNFAYHMFGADISTLSLEISTNNHENWQNLWSISNNQGDLWQTATISLNAFVGDRISLRFISEIPENNFGDISIDEIKLSSVLKISAQDLLIYVDADNDGFGNSEQSLSFCGTEIPVGFSMNNTDCDDTNPAVNPEAMESPCNAIDDNCNQQIDEVDGNILDYEIVNYNDQNCIGVADGIISIAASGGIEPYTYNWTDGVNGSTRNMLTAGNYVCIIADQGGCQILTDTFTISILQQFDYFVSSIKAATCEGIYDGNINISHDETNAPYSYLWSTGDTTKNLVAQTAGIYTLTITDDNGCEVETNEIDLIPNRQIEILQDSIALPQCYADTNGYLSITISSNIGPTFIQWSTGDTLEQITNLSANSYHVMVMDSSNCIADKTFTISEPDKLSSNILTNDPVICYGESSGLLELEINGGTSPYVVEWNNGDSSLINSDLSAGIYEVFITDDNGCQDSMVNLVVDQPDSFYVQLVHVDPSYCKNDNSGEIQIETSGGTGEYTYLWSDGISRMNLAENLSAGLYQVTITDERLCKVSLDEIGVAFVDVKLNSSVTDIFEPLCASDANGSFEINVNNFTELPLNYFINSDTVVTAQTTLQNDNLPAGEYTIYIEDNQGCSGDSIVIEIAEPDSIYISLLEIGIIECFGDDGYVYVQAQGGTGAFQYQLNGEDSVNFITNLTAGVYEFQATDENGCLSDTFHLAFSEPTPLVLDSINTTDLACDGSTQGSINMSLSGGTSPYNFTSTLLGENETGQFTNVEMGSYEIILTDNNGCLYDTISVEINQPQELAIIVDSTNADFCNSSSGVILLSLESNHSDLTYNWNVDTISGAFAQNLSSGSYSVTITDDTGCIDSLKNILIDNIDRDIDLQLEFSDSVSCHNSQNGLISVTLNSDAVAPYQYFINGENYSTTDSPAELLTGISQGNFEITAVDADGCTDTLSNILIEGPLPIMFELSILDSIKCYNDTNAIINVTAEGGNGGFEYLWTNQAQGDTLYNLGPGEYACAIVDQKNCVQFTDTITIINPDSLELYADILDASGEENNGAIYLDIQGGTKPYQYIWDPELPTSVDTIEGLSESDWLLTVVDANGCTIDTSFIISRFVNTSFQAFSSVELYPNPSRELINITSSENIYQVHIYNLQGVLISKHELDEPLMKLSLDVEGLHAGQYYIKVVEVNKSSWHLIQKL